MLKLFVRDYLNAVPPIPKPADIDFVIATFAYCRLGAFLAIFFANAFGKRDCYCWGGEVELSQPGLYDCFEFCLLG